MLPLGWDYVYHVCDFKPKPVLVVPLPLQTYDPTLCGVYTNANYVSEFTLIM